uniref:Uncharacterized protein n=1 Tax=Nucleocytoviricota sp. TaxID=2809609 RepID=A0A9E8JYL6_9VIRU|nr:hypothetical protein [Nucleocytoviricota sp.]
MDQLIVKKIIFILIVNQQMKKVKY